MSDAGVELEAGRTRRAARQCDAEGQARWSSPHRRSSRTQEPGRLERTQKRSLTPQGLREAGGTSDPGPTLGALDRADGCPLAASHTHLRALRARLEPHIAARAAHGERRGHDMPATSASLDGLLNLLNTRRRVLGSNHFRESSADEDARCRGLLLGVREARLLDHLERPRDLGVVAPRLGSRLGSRLPSRPRRRPLLGIGRMS